jgi:hypothetical protein
VGAHETGGWEEQEGAERRARAHRIAWHAGTGGAACLPAWPGVSSDRSMWSMGTGGRRVVVSRRQRHANVLPMPTASPSIHGPPPRRRPDGAGGRSREGAFLDAATHTFAVAARAPASLTVTSRPALARFAFWDGLSGSGLSRSACLCCAPCKLYTSVYLSAPISSLLSLSTSRFLFLFPFQWRWPREVNHGMRWGGREGQ